MISLVTKGLPSLSPPGQKPNFTNAFSKNFSFTTSKIRLSLGLKILLFGFRIGSLNERDSFLMSFFFATSSLLN